LLLLHVTLLFVAVAGTTFAVRACVIPIPIVAVFGETVTPVTDAVTVTEHVSVYPPSAVLTVIIALPAETPVTTPDVLTEATAALLLLHVTLLFVAVAGTTFAVRACVVPTPIVAVFGETVTPVTGTYVEVTVTTQTSAYPPSTVTATAAVVPGEMPVTTPDELTVIIDELLLYHETFLFIAFVGIIVAVRASVFPGVIVAVFGETTTPVTGIAEVTVTTQTLPYPPSAVTATIGAIPYEMPVTTPVELTVATDVLLLIHVTFLFVAFVGNTVAVRAIVFPAAIVAELGVTEMPVTGTTVGDTVTTQVSAVPLFSPTTVAVIPAVPAETPVTTPVKKADELTVATDELLLLHVTLLIVAFAGDTVTVKVCVFPGDSATGFGEIVTLVIGTDTVTEAVSEIPPSTAKTVIAVDPAEIPVTTPDVLTVATDVLLLYHATLLFVAFEGVIVAVNVNVLPTPTIIGFGEIVIPVTGIVTVITHVSVNPPSTVFAVIVAVPPDTPVITPAVLTEAIAELLLLHVTFLFVAFEGATVAVKVCVLPTAIVTGLGEIVTPVAGTFMLIVKVFEVFPAAFSALTVNVDVPDAVGVPEIIPLLFILNPFGRLLPVIEKVIGDAPVAYISCS
jgi:hypothetical protein